MSTAHQGLRAPQLLEKIRAGLEATQKRLPPECLYDDLGSALFEAITLLPEYGLTRAGLRLFSRHAAQMAERLSLPLDVVELGSGSGRKTRLLLERLGVRGSVRYHPVDISAAALAACVREIGRLDGVEIEPLEASHLDGLHGAATARRPEAALLVLFLGSNIGNFARNEARRFVASIRGELRRDDTLLLAADLVKPEAVLQAAYDDPTGVTAAFNKNALGRLNRELGANFDLREFRHQARWNPGERRMEMHLVTQRAQRVHVAELGIQFDLAPGESVWTESSHKFEPGEIAQLGAETGFAAVAEWTDHDWPFAQTLLVAREPVRERTPSLPQRESTIG